MDRDRLRRNAAGLIDRALASRFLTRVLDDGDRRLLAAVRETLADEDDVADKVLTRYEAMQ